MAGPIDVEKKIGGYDAWEVKSAVTTMSNAAKIEHGDQKFLKVVLSEMKKEADRLDDKADLLVKTSAKLKKCSGRVKNNGFT